MLDVKSQDISIPEAVVVLCTAPDEATAQDLAAKVLAEKLAACATLLPGATSLYYWEGKLEQEYEVRHFLMLIHTNQKMTVIHLSKLTGFIARINKNVIYEKTANVNQIITIKRMSHVTNHNEDYSK